MIEERAKAIKSSLDKIQAELSEENVITKLTKRIIKLEQENLHLKEQLEPFKDEYFKGLTHGTIAGLAKKCIRMTAENTKYTNFLEWLLTQQYYILPPKIKSRINEVLNETAK